MQAHFTEQVLLVFSLAATQFELCSYVLVMCRRGMRQQCVDGG